MDNLALFIVFGVIGVICIFNLTVGKRARMKATQHNKDVFGALKDKAVDALGKAKYEKMKKIPYMGDNANGYLICFSKEDDVMALITFDDVYKMKYKSKKNCEIITDGDDRHYDSLVLRVSAPELEGDVSIRLAERRHRRKSYIGKAIMEDAQEFRDVITGQIKQGE